MVTVRMAEQTPLSMKLLPDTRLEDSGCPDPFAHVGSKFSTLRIESKRNKRPMFWRFPQSHLIPLRRLRPETSE